MFATFLLLKSTQLAVVAAAVNSELVHLSPQAREHGVVETNMLGEIIDHQTLQMLSVELNGLKVAKLGVGSAEAKVGAGEVSSLGHGRFWFGCGLEVWDVALPFFCSPLAEAMRSL